MISITYLLIKYYLFRTCVSTCPPRSYADEENVCQPCHEACEMCTGPTVKNCLSCSPGHVRVIDLDVCLQQCPEGYFESKFATDLQYFTGKHYRHKNVTYTGLNQMV